MLMNRLSPTIKSDEVIICFAFDLCVDRTKFTFQCLLRSVDPSYGSAHLAQGFSMAYALLFDRNKVAQYLITRGNIGIE